MIDVYRYSILGNQYMKGDFVVLETGNNTIAGQEIFLKYAKLEGI